MRPICEIVTRGKHVNSLLADMRDAIIWQSGAGVLSTRPSVVWARRVARQYSLVSLLGGDVFLYLPIEVALELSFGPFKLIGRSEYKIILPPHCMSSFLVYGKRRRPRN